MAHAQDDGRERALEYFRLSVAEYEAGHFEEAAQLLRSALRLHDDPMLHYNLARALEGSGDMSGAVESFETYLEQRPDAPDRGAVESRLTTLRRQLREREQLERERDEARARAGGDGDEGSEVEEDEAYDEGAPDDGGGGSVNIAPWLVAGAGVAVVGVGFAFAAVGQSKHDEAVANPEHRMASELSGQADTFATLANVFFVVGGVAAAAGIVWGILTLGGDDDDASASLGIGPGSVAVRGTFR